MSFEPRSQEIVEAPVRFNPGEGWGWTEVVALVLGGVAWGVWGFGEELGLAEWIDTFVVPVGVGIASANLMHLAGLAGPTRAIR